jgi:hypothetical protein
MKALTVVKAVKAHISKRLVHKAHHVAHMSYLAAVTVEAHGIYGYCAGVLLVVVVIDMFCGNEGE